MKPTHTVGENDDYDIFLSLGGPDRVEVNLLAGELRDMGLRVFVDEVEISYFEGITAKIERSLRGSRVLVAYYSAAYPSRSACQFELTAAFLASQREGEPLRRIIVVNPEADEGHIQPAELSDARFAVQPRNTRELKDLAARIKAKVDTVEGRLGGVGFTARPRWYAGKVPGAVGFTGRYRELWQLHTALAKESLPLTQEATSGPVLVLAGAAGTGKTALVAAYAWQFGAAFRGGVYWIDMSGVDGTAAQVLAGYADRVRVLAETLGLPVEGVGRGRLFGMVADHVSASPEQSLWVVDGLVAGLGSDLPGRLVIPAGAGLRTIFVGRRDPFDGGVPVMSLGGLGADDSRVLLSEYRKPDGPEEAAALDRLAERLGGHPGALVLAGRRLQNRKSMLSYREHLEDLESRSDVARSFGELVRQSVGELDSVQLLLLGIASVCAPAWIPADVLVEAMRKLSIASAPVKRQVADAVVDLHERLLATHDDGRWQFSAIAREMAGERIGDAVPVTELTAAVAQAILEAGARTSAPTDRVHLFAHAARLCDRTDLAPGQPQALLTMLAEHYGSRGDAAYAAGYRDRLLSYRPDDAGALADAAWDHHVAGDRDRAVDLARRAVGSALAAPGAVADAAVLHRCRLVLAEALDGALRFDEAEEHWTQVRAVSEAGRGLPPAEHVAAGIAYARSRCRRSELRQARASVTALIEEYEERGEAEGGEEGEGRQPRPGTGVADQIGAARLELARILMLTGDGPKARRTAEALVEHYRDLGFPRHANSLQAQEILAETVLTTYVTEMKLDPVAYARAEQALRRLWEENCRDYGEHSPAAFSAAVACGVAMMSLGQRKTAHKELTRIRESTGATLGPLHPLHLRATFLLGQILSQRNDFHASAEMHSYAFEGQRVVLGPAHPHTLHSQYELAIALKLGGGGGSRVATLLDEVNRLLPRSMEYSSDLRWQARIARALTPLPSFVWRWAKNSGSGSDEDE